MSVTFSQGSVFLLFNAAHVFGISARLDGRPKPSKALPVSVGEDIGKAEATAVASERQGAAVPGKHQEGGLRPAPAEGRLPYFISQGGNIELKFALLWKSGGSK